MKILVLRECEHFQVHFQKNLKNLKFVINSKTDFSRGQKRKKLHFDTKFHIFGSTWE